MEEKARHLSLWVNPNFKPRAEAKLEETVNIPELIAQMAKIKSEEKMKDPEDLQDTLVRSFTKFYSEYDIDALMEEARDLGVM